MLLYIRNWLCAFTFIDFVFSMPLLFFLLPRSSNIYCDWPDFDLGINLFFLLRVFVSFTFNKPNGKAA